MPSEEVVQKRLAALKNVASEVFGYPDFKPLQYEAMEANLRGQDVLVVAATGMGKSAVFQAPALVRPGLTLIISPLVALMKDHADKLKRWGIAADYLSHLMNSEEQKDIYRRLNTLSLLYVAPERITTQVFIDALRACRIGAICFDEAHTIVEYSRDFRASYSKVGRLRTMFPLAPILAVTATADKRTEQEIVRLTGMDPTYKRVIAPPDRLNLIYHTVDEAKVNNVAQALRKYQGSGSAIIYANTRPITETISAKLNEEFDLPTTAYYHAKMEPTLRSSVLERFISGELKTVVATSAFGMGIDRPDIRVVYAYHTPPNIYAVSQAMGRAGRDGLPSNCILNLSKEGRHKVEQFRRMANPPFYVYETLWRIITRGGRLGQGETVKCTIAYLANAQRVADFMKESNTTAALSFMEFCRDIDIQPGPLTYRLPLRNSHTVRLFAQRYSGIKIEGNVVTVSTQQDEADPVEGMVAAGGVSYAPPEESKLIKILKDRLSITEEMVQQKLRDAEAQYEVVRRFAEAGDKHAFLRKCFLEAI